MLLPLSCVMPYLNHLEEAVKGGVTAECLTRAVSNAEDSLVRRTHNLQQSLASALEGTVDGFRAELNVGVQLAIGRGGGPRTPGSGADEGTRRGGGGGGGGGGGKTRRERRDSAAVAKATGKGAAGVERSRSPPRQDAPAGGADKDGARGQPRTATGELIVRLIGGNPLGPPCRSQKCTGAKPCWFSHVGK